MFPIYLHAFMIFFALNLPYSDGKLDLWSQQELQDRIEALEKQDITKSPIIKLLTEELQDQNEKLTAQQATINNLSRLLDAQATNLLQKDETITLLQENIDNLKGALERTDAHVAKLNMAVREPRSQDRKEKKIVKAASNVEKTEDIKEIQLALEKAVQGELNGSERLNVIKEYTRVGQNSILQGNTADERSDSKSFKADSKQIYFQNQHVASEFEPSTEHENGIKQSSQSSTDEDKKINSYHKTLDKQNRHHFQQRSANDGQIAFHARIDPDSSPSLGMDQTIKFENALLNLGNGYHKTTGIFTAPRAGLYLFSVTLCSWFLDKPNFNAVIVKNGNWAAAITGHGGETAHQLNQGSVTLVMQLHIGDEVWVKNTNTNNPVITGWGYTTFTGVLISGM